MIRKVWRCICVLAAAAFMVGGMQAAVKAQGDGQQGGAGLLAENTGVTVYTGDEFMSALAQKKSPITVAVQVTIDTEAEANGQMRPVMIPANTVIQGITNGGICSRSPVQLEGDGVIFRNIELHFVSTNALGSVPHREIFLAGHSLTLDNVHTYLKGGGGSGVDGLGGTEKELLPTVYAGGYPGTEVADHASLTVANSNAGTIFQAIHMGHGAEDGNVPYQGKAVLDLDAQAAVRDMVDTSPNSQAEISIAGEKNSQAKAKRFCGNEKTVLTLAGASMESEGEERVTVENIGDIVLKDGACLAPVTTKFRNIVLQNGACLDLDDAGDVAIAGNFAGETDTNKERGILVLNSQGSLRIGGNVTGTTQFQTYHRLFPGTFLPDKKYIFAASEDGPEPNFVLAQKSIENGYSLAYAGDAWTIQRETAAFRGIGRIEILSAPSEVDLRKIKPAEDGKIAEDNPYFEIVWYDEDGVAFSNDEIVMDEYSFYDYAYVIPIKTEYWNSDAEDVLDKTDWFQFIFLTVSEDHPGRYYLQSLGNIAPGNYTFLFCSDYCEEEAVTVADVKALKDIVMAESSVAFYGQDVEKPDHVHCYQETVGREPTCTEPGILRYTCECGDTYTREKAAQGHRPVADPAVTPTETMPGKTEGSHCSVCGKIIKAQETIPAAGAPAAPGNPQAHKHAYQSAVTQKPDCTRAGVRTYTCSCGDTYTEKISPAGHQYVRELIPATLQGGGKIRQVCRVCSDAQDVTVIDSPRKLIWDKSSYSYDGKVKTPAVTVKDSKGKSLAAGTDYQVSYQKGRKNPGVYTVTVDFCGNYSGRMTGTFTIKPKKTSIKKVVAKSKGLQVTWKKQTAQIDGYQIQYGTNKNFTGRTVKYATAKKNVTVKKISGLKGKKKYYIRVRTYKTVKVGGKQKRLYSDWSGKKTVVTKK